jgi:mono/diheme cytochrome c family protein
MVFALSGGHEIGLAVAGGIFVSFSLLSAFVFPRFNPDFPGGKGLRWYIPLCVLIFVGMISSVLVFGREEKAATAATSTTTTTTSTTTAPSSAAAVTSGPYADGNAAAGKAVFLLASSTCATCHTLKAAGSTGTVGPDLDDVAAYAAKAKLPLGEFLVDAITKPPAPYVPPGFGDSMPTTFGSSLSAKQIADLVQFIASSAAG